MSITSDKITQLAIKQKEYFQTGETLSISFRIESLKTLYRAIKINEEKIISALKEDLGKSGYESYMCEIGMALSEITYMIKNVKKYSKKRKVRTPLAQFPAKSYEIAMPYGNTLIMSPWNYPFLLSISPLANAISAGNTAIVKPSAYSPKTSEIIYKIISENFSEKYIAVILGGRSENAQLLKTKFDFVFFTGSQAVGKEVLLNTAQTLTPAVLELGGKSPCIVDETAKLKLASKRIVFGKFLNCGQTCVAPDYILCHKSVKDLLIQYIVSEIKAQFGENALENVNYGKIISQKHFDRLLSLIDDKKVVCGGKSDSATLKIQPTVLDGVTWQDGVMQEEIFGPILPILTFEDIAEVYDVLKDKAKPLALYVFSENKRNCEYIINNVRFGGGCVNDVIIHLATSEMGFGGVGESGMGSYHGKKGFEAFSHYKSIVKKSTKIDLPMRYQPYNKSDKLLRKFLK